LSFVCSSETLTPLCQIRRHIREQLNMNTNYSLALYQLYIYISYTGKHTYACLHNLYTCAFVCVRVSVCVCVCACARARMDFRAFSALEIEADERLAPFIPTDRRSGTYLTWGKMLCRASLDRQIDFHWVRALTVPMHLGLRASLDALKNIKIDALWRNRFPRLSVP
jgi:hypothetical protein